MEKFNRLCEAARSITPQATVNFTGEGELWRGSVSVGGIILVDAIGTTEEVIQQLTQKLERMSQRVIARLSIAPPPPPED